MGRLVDLEKLNRLDWLISHAATGTPEELARQLDKSPRSVYELIAFLKEEMDAPIVYSKTRESYVYEYPTNFILDLNATIRSKKNYKKNTTAVWSQSGNVSLHRKGIFKK